MFAQPPPESNPTPLDSLIAAVLALDADDLGRLLAALHDHADLRGAGFLLRERYQSEERHPARNAAIRAYRAKGGTIGQLALRYGLSR